MPGNGWTEIYVLNVGVAWWNSQILIAYPQSIALCPPFLIPNASFSILLPQISLILPHFSIFNSSSSFLNQKNGIFDSKSPQNRLISGKMFASAACSFFQVWNKLEFTDWSQANRKFNCGEITIFREIKMIPPPHQLGLIHTFTIFG